MVEAHRRGYRVLPNGDVLSPRGRIRKLSTSKDGYLLFSIGIWDPETRETKSRTVHVHRLAAYQAYGALVVAPLTRVRHLNGIPQDNRLDNLVVVSRT